MIKQDVIDSAVLRSGLNFTGDTAYPADKLDGLAVSAFRKVVSYGAWSWLRCKEYSLVRKFVLYLPRDCEGVIDAGGNPYEFYGDHLFFPSIEDGGVMLTYTSRRVLDCYENDEDVFMTSAVFEAVVCHMVAGFFRVYARDEQLAMLWDQRFALAVDHAFTQDKRSVYSGE